MRIGVVCKSDNKIHSKVWLTHTSKDNDVHVIYTNIPSLPNHKKVQHVPTEKCNVVGVLERARTDGIDWLLVLRDTDILDVRANVSFTQLCRSIRKTCGYVHIPVFEMIKTKKDYTSSEELFFEEEEYYYTQPKLFVDPRNLMNISNPNVQGCRTMYNVACTSWKEIKKKQIAPHDFDLFALSDMKESTNAFKDIFTAEPRAWRIMSFSMCIFDEWVTQNPMEEDDDEEGHRILYEETAIIEKNIVSVMMKEGEITRLSLSPTMNVTMTEQKSEYDQPLPVGDREVKESVKDGTGIVGNFVEYTSKPFHVAHIPDAFTKEEMENILRNAANGTAEFQQGNPDHRWLYTRIGTHVRKLNRDYWNFNIAGCFEHVQYREQHPKKTTEEWETDIVVGKHNRKLSVHILLSVDFEGGDMYVHNNKVFPKKKRGDMVIYPSFMVHKNDSVTSGIRRSLTLFVSGEPFR